MNATSGSPDDNPAEHPQVSPETTSQGNAEVVPPAAVMQRGAFTRGTIMRHVLTMTATGSIGLMAIFMVEFLSLLYISQLGRPNLTAGVGFATQVSFFFMATSIAMSIAVSALVSRALGAGDKARASRLAASALVHILVASIALGVLAAIFARPMAELLGARGETLEVAVHYIRITMPAFTLVALSMAFAGLIRSTGDARRAMYVTLGGAIFTAIVDPILIFGLDLGVTGAAITVVLSRCITTFVGWHGASRVHKLIGTPTRSAVLRDLRPMLSIAIPAIITNLATPVSTSFAMRIFSGFGDGFVAGLAIIDRVTPVAFGVLFALTGAVGPIIGQNYGARLPERVQRTLTDCFIVVMVYVICVWFVLWAAEPLIIKIFAAKGDTARLVSFFCHWGAAAWLFLGALFVANATFNNLGFPLLATAFNWGRATLGTMPFVYLGATYWGPEGAMVGIIAGAAIFGTGAVISAYLVTRKIVHRLATTGTQSFRR